MSAITLNDLRQILAICAGEDDDSGLDASALDTPFTDLGYDSLAMLETTAHVSQRYGVEIDDAEVSDLRTPRQFLDGVNEVLARAAA
ncbi:acyl carrier protein [Streptomyces sp. VRA16 Mangrove soil]|uniref:acyl carrier protein n=1 Tax=Streptomyces sp. VRA16 Mangrove soil TaxID=2817434 RepID=UPI001A9DA85E|nr:acyl carrier protein [Streptomyces sp. VRA16 Mangrove soil]MBO1332634.1 acyl carrier protein [Streptomyces sp. VRA16 Mangrove soil]